MGRCRHRPALVAAAALHGQQHHQGACGPRHCAQCGHTQGVVALDARRREPCRGRNTEVGDSARLERGAAFRRLQGGFCRQTPLCGLLVQAARHHQRHLLRFGSGAGRVLGEARKRRAVEGHEFAGSTQSGGGDDRRQRVQLRHRHIKPGGFQHKQQQRHLRYCGAEELRNGDCHQNRPACGRQQSGRPCAGES